jgi:RHS repeat-associated protein
MKYGIEEYNKHYYTGNHLSSTQLVTDGTGVAIQQVEYAPFGEVVNEYNIDWSNGQVPDFKFNGKKLDEENGMYYFEARYHAPPSFISRDPLFEKYPTLSPYSYCANNPLRYIDPTGETIWIAGKKGNMYQYKEGKLYNQDGSEFTGKVRGFVKRTMNALNDIKKYAEGVATVNELENSENNFTIQYNNKCEFKEDNSNKAYWQQKQSDLDGNYGNKALVESGKDYSGGSGGTIGWNMVGELLPTTQGTQRHGVLALAHELFHALDANRGLLDDRLYLGIKRSEWQAVYRENMLRKQMGEPYRTYYNTDEQHNGAGARMLDVNKRPMKPMWYAE